MFQTMFPRQSTVIRYIGALLAGGVCVWLFESLVTPSSPQHHVIKYELEQLPPQFDESIIQNPVSHNESRSSSSVLARDHTPLNISVKDPPQTHHHGNESLVEAMKDAALHKVNQTELRDIIKDLNSTKLVDYSNLPNPHPFKYILNNPNMCNIEDLFMIIYIHTAVGNYKRRMVIRQTWGNPKFYKDVKVRLVFVMGIAPENPEAQAALEFENDQYNDIVQEDFKDAYRNLTYKGIAALKWITKYCSNAKFVLKSDDDIFVNMFTLLRHLQSYDALGKNKNMIMCLVWYHMPVMREGKWKVSQEDWKEDYYPTYCSGSAFTLTTDAAIAMHNVSYYVPFFWVDDFYITGLLPLKLGMKHTSFGSTYVLNGKQLEEKFTGPQWVTYIFSHIHDLNKIQSVWAKLVDLAEGKTRPNIQFALPGQLPDEQEFRRKKEEERLAKEKKKKEKKEREAKAKAAKLGKP